METFDEWLHKLAKCIANKYEMEIRDAYSSINLAEAKFEYLGGVDPLIYAKAF